MTPLTFTQPRATLEELFRFANVVRAAGGGNPLDALMPAVPEDSSQCLIAKNLNFNCRVSGSINAESEWSMYVDDGDLAANIAAAIGTDCGELTADGWEIPLPAEIGAVAEAFDMATHAIDNDFDDDDGRVIWTLTNNEEDRQRLKEFWPYIEASRKESYENASFITPEGKLVL